MCNTWLEGVARAVKTCALFHVMTRRSPQELPPSGRPRRRQKQHTNAAPPRASRTMQVGHRNEVLPVIARKVETEEGPTPFGTAGTTPCTLLSVPSKRFGSWIGAYRTTGVGQEHLSVAPGWSRGMHLAWKIDGHREHRCAAEAAPTWSKQTEHEPTFVLRLSFSVETHQRGGSQLGHVP